MIAAESLNEQMKAVKTGLFVNYKGKMQLAKGKRREVVKITFKNIAANADVKIENFAVNVGFKTKKEADCFLAGWNLCDGLTFEKSIESEG